MIECRTCGEEFKPSPSKPGYYNECEQCTLANKKLPLAAKEINDRSLNQLKRLGAETRYDREIKFNGKKSTSNKPKDRRT